jgi:hypothetical protein
MMGNTRFRGNAASDAAGCVQQGSSAGNAACSAKDREAQRRKWMLQMGTVVLMGVSGLCLHFLIKPLATAASVKEYCQIEGTVYAIGSTARMANSEMGVCVAKDGVARWDLTSGAK